jgi:glycerophosphoryl diester phosphodiesterase
MPAFEHAVSLGYRYIETDVHVTADGELLAFHDDVLDRVTDGHGRIDALPWSTVRDAKVDGREPIPRLEDLLGTWPDVRVNIDPKHDGAVDALAAVLQRCNAVDRVCIGAFSDKRLARVRALLGPRVCTSLGPRNIAKLRSACRSDGSPRRARRCQPASVVSRSSTRGSSRPRTGATSPCTCGRSTTQPRCGGCSTSASTGS